jgi:stage IV sporulation protein FB
VDFLRLVFTALFHCVKVGKFFGIAVRIHWSFWALPLGFVIGSLPSGPLNAAIIGGLILLFYAQGVVLHEYGHALTARFFGIKTRDIILTPIGGIARMECMPENPVHEIIIALAGPAVNVVFATVFFFVLAVSGQLGTSGWRTVPIPIIQQWADAIALLLMVNVGMTFFNLLPAFPSDGGRIVRAFLSLFFSRLTATQVAVYSGACVALGLAIFGIYIHAFQFPLIAILFTFVGQMELMMVKRQAEMESRPRAQSAFLSPERAAQYEPPEPDFSGYAWDSQSAAWIEWRDGVAIRKCRMRVG